MGYEPTDHWIILDHWITKGSHMSSSCLVYHIVIFVKLSVIKNTCVRDHITYIIHINCILSTGNQAPNHFWSNHFITEPVSPRRQRIRIAALWSCWKLRHAWRLGSSLGQRGWSKFKPCGTTDIWIYIYMFRLCSVLSCIKHLYNYYPICSYTQCHTVDGWEILHQLGTIGIPVKHCKWWDCNRIKHLPITMITYDVW